MDVISKDVTAAAGFDPIAWKEELLTLNPWARGLTIDEANAEFAAARQKATLARHAEGKEAWNGWANGMLALKAALEAAGQWAAKRGRSWQALKGENKAAQVWLTLASAVFSTWDSTHCFETDVSFLRFIFPSDTWFVGATFGGKVFFPRATFSGKADFESATFSGEANFVSATFSGEANGRADFQKATFSGRADFQDATFSGKAEFQNVTFSGRTSLDKVRFNAEADFKQAKFEGPITFANSIFQQAANFEGVDSGATFSLANATFKQVPGFISATFKGTLRLDNVEMPRYRWTFGYTPDKDARARFRELRRQAVEAHDRGREIEFFAQEVRTGRFHAKGLPPWVPKAWSWRFWFGLGFGALSDFGRSLWRPLVSWVALTVLCAAFYLGEHDDMRQKRTALAPTGLFSTLTAYAVTTRDAWDNPPACREPSTSTNPVTEAIFLSLKNAVVFNIGSTDSARRTFACLYGLEKDTGRVPAVVFIASMLQALASGLLIFLFVLAVRNLLRLK